MCMSLSITTPAIGEMVYVLRVGRVEIVVVSDVQTTHDNLLSVLPMPLPTGFSPHGPAQRHRWLTTRSTRPRFRNR